MNFNEIHCPMCNQEFEILNIYLPKEQHMSQNTRQYILNENIKISKSKCNIL